VLTGRVQTWGGRESQDQPGKGSLLSRQIDLRHNNGAPMSWTSLGLPFHAVSGSCWSSGGTDGQDGRLGNMGTNLSPARRCGPAGEKKDGWPATSGQKRRCCARRGAGNCGRFRVRGRGGCCHPRNLYKDAGKIAWQGGKWLAEQGKDEHSRPSLGATMPTSMDVHGDGTGGRKRVSGSARNWY